MIKSAASAHYWIGVEAMINNKDVIKKLKEIYEPCMPLIDIVEMGLIYEVNVEGNDVGVVMTFTTPHCPAGFRMVKTVEDKIKELEGVGRVDVKLTFDPPWTKERLSEENRKKLGFM